MSEHKKVLIAYFTWAENAADTSKVDASSVKDISAVLPDSQIEGNVLGVYRDDILQS